MYSYLLALFSTIFIIWFMIPFARRIQLVDRPVGRKQHQGSIPLIGGFAMFLGFTLSALTLSMPPDDIRSFLFACIVLIVVGVYDDRHEISVRSKFITQLFAALIMTSTANHVIYNMGDLFGEGDIMLAGWGIPFTVFIVIGVTNALNMSDGIDGLAGGVSLISFLSMYLLAMEAGRAQEAQILLLFIVVLIPFFIMNAPFFGKKSARVFMGDAGSMFLGFGLAWYITVLSQGKSAVMSPVIALWIFAIPLLDTVSIMFRRMAKGRSPFKPDRDHFHHIFQAAGYSTRKTLIIILLAQIGLSAIGIAGHKAQVPDWVMFWGFFLLLVMFYWALKRAWYVMTVLRKIGGGAA